jgi:hypothetical protein
MAGFGDRSLEHIVSFRGGSVPGNLGRVAALSLLHGTVTGNWLALARSVKEKLSIV